ncbi:hypothetical protein M1146_08265 [Patescibacteria group bacterium]|nr:hypothetical protein [Patescibacteria group bacterium]
MKEQLYVGLKGKLTEVPNDWYHNQGTWVLNAVFTFLIVTIVVSLIISNGGLIQTISKLVGTVIK